MGNIPKRLELPLLFGCLSLGLVLSWILEIYDLGSPIGRVVVTSSTALASFGIVMFGLLPARMTQREMVLASGWAIMPWISFFPSQLAYVGFLIIPIEVIASIFILKWKAPVTLLHAFALAIVTRAAAFGVTYGIADIARYSTP